MTNKPIISIFPAITAKYFIWLAGQVICSAIYVLKLVWERKLNLNTEFVEIEVGQKSDVFYAMFGNSITLTPGTVTAFIDQPSGKLYAHAISKKTADDLKSGVMLDKVSKVFL